MVDLGPWSAAEPADARRWLAQAHVPWWIAGGWALDLYLGHRTRPHSDLDVGCFRADLASIRKALVGFEFHAARDGRLRRLASGEAPRADDHTLWCRPVDSAAWQLELLLEEREGDEWVFRRDRSVRLPASELVRPAADGTPIVRPEVQLLYKASRARAKDVADLEAVLPRLDREAREWLRLALARVQPGHRWLAIVA